MGISKAEVINFQSHEKTVLDFSEKMNVLFGDSDQGKSSVIRSIKWCIQNRPNGDKFRRHDTDESSVLLTKDDGFWVNRIRSDSKNEYRVKGIKDPLKALRMEVPEDVTTGLNLDENNIQSQEDVWFLLDQSPGQVSKKLNKVSGLEMTDKVMKQVNTDIKVANAERNSKNKEHIATKSKIMDLEWTEKANKFLTKLEKYQTILDELKYQYAKITALIVQLRKYREKKKAFISEEAIKELDAIIKLQNELADEKADYSETKEVIDDLKLQRQKAKAINVIDISELENLAISLESEKDRYEDIENCLIALKVNKMKLKEAIEKVKKTDKKYFIELKRLGKCPTCGIKT